MNARVEEKYHPNGKLEARLYYNEKNELHREDGPAEERFYTNKRISSRRWYFEGMLHREDGPAIEILHFNGTISCRAWYIFGKLHREDGPAQEYFTKNQRPVGTYYYLNNKHLSISEHRRQVMLQKLTTNITTDCEVFL
jgi:hypothetical protein